MANILNNIDINKNNIKIGQFPVPFKKATRCDLINPDNTVRVLFDGAMGLTEELAIDFQLPTAEKVNEFVEKIFPVLEASANSHPSDIEPLYTISPDRVTKRGESLPSIDELDEESVHLSLYVWAEMANRHDSLVPSYLTPSVFFDHMRSVPGAWNDFNFEIFNNLCHSTKNVVLTDTQKEDILAIGDQVIQHTI